MKNQLLTESEIEKYLKGNTLLDRIQALFDYQIEHWNVAAENYSNLSSAITKEVVIDGTSVMLQVNPKRISSTTADVNKRLSSNECILCESNLPDKQRFIKYYKEYNFLINPFPIFKEHFTIVKSKHIPQSILYYLNDLLLISRDVSEEFIVFYNGPACGASIPHHLHFQMGNKESFPIIRQIDEKTANQASFSIDRKRISIKCFEITNRNILTIESNDSVEILNGFSIIYNVMKTFSTKDNEPLMNLLCIYDNKKWKLIIFLRKKHRPDFYFKKESSMIIVSPAAVDMSGFIILPREEDLEKLTEKKILEMYREVTVSKEHFEYLKTRLKAFYS